MMLHHSTEGFIFLKLSYCEDPKSLVLINKWQRGKWSPKSGARFHLYDSIRVRRSYLVVLWVTPLLMLRIGEMRGGRNLKSLSLDQPTVNPAAAKIIWKAKVDLKLRPSCGYFYRVMSWIGKYLLKRNLLIDGQCVHIKLELTISLHNWHANIIWASFCMHSISNTTWFRW